MRSLLTRCSSSFFTSGRLPGRFPRKEKCDDLRFGALFSNLYFIEADAGGVAGADVVERAKKEAFEGLCGSGWIVIFT
jgi:hypothetical protein